MSSESSLEKLCLVLSVHITDNGMVSVHTLWTCWVQWRLWFKSCIESNQAPWRQDVTPRRNALASHSHNIRSQEESKAVSIWEHWKWDWICLAQAIYTAICSESKHYWAFFLKLLSLLFKNVSESHSIGSNSPQFPGEWAGWLRVRSESQ